MLLWGGVQSIIRQAPGAGLTETEQESLQRISERLLRMAVERSLSRRDMEFTIQELSSVREDGLSLEVNNNLTAEQIRLFMKRAESLLESHNIPNEPYDVTPGEAFGLLIEASLDVDPSLQ